MLNNFKEFVSEITRLSKAYDILLKVYQEVIYKKKPLPDELREEIIIFFRFDDSE